MAQLFEETGLNGKAVDVEFGANKDGKPEVKWNMEVVDGPHAGKKASYKGKLDAEQIKWTKRDMIAIGWKGQDVRTFVEDVKSANKTVTFDAEIARWTNPRTNKEMQWTTARSIGFSSRPLDKITDDKIANVNSWFADAGEIGGGEKKAEDDGLPF